MTIATALGAVVLVLVALFAWGLVRLRRGHRQFVDAVRGVRETDIGTLVAECVAGFARLGDRLDLSDAGSAIALLDRHLSGSPLVRLKLAFARPGVDWYFAWPTGAVLGELLRLHAGGTWQPADGGGLCVVLPAGDGTATAHPFEKVIKHGIEGGPGDLVAYLAMARRFDPAASVPAERMPA